MSNKPLYHISARDVEATVWNNTVERKDGSKFEVKTVTVHKNFVKDSVYNKTSSFSIGDIPKIIAALDEVYKKNVLNSNLTSTSNQLDEEN